MKEMVGGCCVCADENGWTDNPLIYCDGENCEVAVHQGCYGIQEVPEGEWLCAKCSSAASSYPGGPNEATFCCQLCPFDYGAVKRTDREGWAHVICALYIPEVRFGNVHSMEPVILSDVPSDKFNKTCYICNDERPGDAKKGACMSCNKSTCKRSFHVTCAQRKGLLCEEGAISRNVKYCGYCESHLKKAVNDPAIKVIPACPPVQRIPKEQDKKKVLSTSHPTAPKSHMLVDPLPRPDQVNTVLGLGSTANSILPNSVNLDERPPSGSITNPGIFAPPPTTFSPPLTTSSRSSVALESTPPLSTKTTISSGPLLPSNVLPPSTSPPPTPMANGSTVPSSETTVGSHCLQQLQLQSSAAASNTHRDPTPSVSSSVNDLNGYPAAAQLSSFMHEIPARNTTSVASLLPPGAAEYHLNGSGDEEKTVKAVLTAPLTKAKRMRDSKNELMDKSTKRARANPRAPSAVGSSSNSSGGTVGKSASMQRLISLVAPVVNETVTDFQRDRVADRTAAERRAAAAQSQPSTSTNGTSAILNSQPEVHANSNSTPNTNNVIPGTGVAVPGTSNSIGDPVTQNGAVSSSHGPRHTLPSFMEQLLERQWDQGQPLLMANAHFDVAQLLSCLFQLKSENNRLEESLSSLRKRRDHLYQLNTKLAEVNTLDVPKRQRDAILHQQHLDALAILPKIEPKNDLVAPTTIPLPANHGAANAHSSIVSLFEDVKTPKTGANFTAGNRKSAPITMPPMTMSAAAAPLTTNTTSAAALAVQNHRATPSTAGAPLAATPVMSAATAVNEMAMSPDRVLAALGMYRPMMQDPNVAAQLTMLNNFPGTNGIFNLLRAQPGIMNMISTLPPTSQTLTGLPPNSTTPNGK